MTLSVRVFNSGYVPINADPGWDDHTTATWPSSTATLIAGARDAILVDALMTIEQGRQLVSWIAHSGKDLKQVVITHGHGDHFFGAGAVLQAYPAARLVARNDDVIDEARLHLQPDILSNWIGWFGDQFDQAASIPEKFESEVLDIEGRQLTWLAVVQLGPVLSQAARLQHSGERQANPVVAGRRSVDGRLPHRAE